MAIPRGGTPDDEHPRTGIKVKTSSTGPVIPAPLHHPMRLGRVQLTTNH